MIILYLFLPEFFVRFLAVGSQYIYCAVSKEEDYRRAYITYHRSVYSCGCEEEGATPLNTADLWEYGANP